MNHNIEAQCRYLEEQAAKIGIDVVVTPNNRGDFDMQRNGLSVRVSMEDRLEDFYLKAWKLMGKTD